MDTMLMLAVASAISGWGITAAVMRQRDRFRTAWRIQCELRETYDARLAETETSRVRFRDAFGHEARKAIILRGERDQARDALKCACETKRAVESALAESEEFAREATELSAARWKQIEELQAQLSRVTK